MIIILKNIPANTEDEQIEDFIQPALNGGFLSKNGYIEDILILALNDRKTHRVEYYGLVRITPDSVAKRVIKKLNRKKISGKHINVSDYRIRHWQNDPRINRAKIDKLLDKRRGERRRGPWGDKEDIRQQELRSEKILGNLAE